MTSHELARILLSKGNHSITASLDTSIDDATSGDRVFSDELDAVQFEPDGTAVLIFPSSYSNTDLSS